MFLPREKLNMFSSICLLLALFNTFQVIKTDSKLIGHTTQSWCDSDVCWLGKLSFLILCILYSVRRSWLMVFIPVLILGTFILNNPLFMRSLPFLMGLMYVNFDENVI